MTKLMERGVVSFPKCGRTWIRLFLEYYRGHSGLGSRAVVVFRHDGRFGFERFVLLLRHPCDVMVSYFWHAKIRTSRPDSKLTLSNFIRNERYGLPYFNAFHREWSKRIEGQMVVRYEDLFDPQTWRKMLEFWGIPLYADALVNAFRATKFNTIRANLKEISTFPSSWRYLAAEHGHYSVLEPGNPEAHKFRHGKVGGYVDYLSEEDIDYILSTFTLGERLESYREQYLSERPHA